MTTQQAYSSTVVSPWLALASVITGAALTAWTLTVAPGNLVGPLAGLVVAAAGIYLTTVRLAVGTERIVLGQGPWPRSGRVIPTAHIAEAHAENLTLGQVFGIGIAWQERTTRMTVRPGPALVLSLSNGECIRISTRDPDAAVAVIQSARAGDWPGGQPEDALTAGTLAGNGGSMTGNQQDRRPWFGPKRIGFGLRPQTWQGWLITAVFIAAVVILVRLIH
jgi:hypothetical protein